MSYIRKLARELILSVDKIFACRLPFRMGATQHRMRMFDNQDCQFRPLPPGTSQYLRRT